MTKNNEFMRMDRRFFLSSASKLLGVSVVSSIMPSIVAASELKDTLRIAIAKPAGDINPHKYTGLWGVQDLVFEPLLKYGHDGKIEPGLATEWQVEDGGKLLELTLREGVTFHDGSPFDAAAVEWNLKRWIGIDANNWMNSSRLYAGGGARRAPFRIARRAARPRPSRRPANLGHASQALAQRIPTDDFWTAGCGIG